MRYRKLRIQTVRRDHCCWHCLVTQIAATIRPIPPCIESGGDLPTEFTAISNSRICEIYPRHTLISQE